MEIKIFNLKNWSDYPVFIRDRGLKLDIYYDPDFLLIDAQLQHGEAEVYCVTDGGRSFVYPYIRRRFLPHEPILKHFVGYSDITAPYGYCGPFANDHSLFFESERFFIEYAKSEAIVSEFVRYHYDALSRFELEIKNVHNRDILVLDLNQGFENIWKNEFSGTNRNLIRRMEKDGYQFEICRDNSSIEEFVDMYKMTMENAGASKFYFFPRDFFHELFSKLGDRINLGLVRREGLTFCAVLFLKHNCYMNYYLSARKIDSGKVPANNFALFHFIKMGVDEGFSRLNFGGGNSMSHDDPLFKFKSNFTKKMESFYIGKRIHNVEIYEAIRAAYVAENGPEAYARVKNLLHFYRD
jgi:hypothetical protein